MIISSSIINKKVLSIHISTYSFAERERERERVRERERRS
jgi:hypothetical protein